MKKFSLSGFINILLLYLAFMLVIGIFRIEMILSVLDPAMLYTARVSAYMSYVVNLSLIFVVTIFLMGLPWYILQYIESEISLEDFAYAARQFIMTLIIFEIFKASLLMLFLKEEMADLTADLTLVDQLTHTTWYHLNKIADIMAIVIGSILFGWYLNKETKKIKEAVIPPLIVLVVLLFFNVVRI